MKKTHFYPNAWHIPPYPFNMMANVDARDRQTKDLVLTNPYLKEKNVSELDINLVRLAAVDNNGTAHNMMDFTGQQLLLKGIDTGLYLRTKCTVALAPGTYKGFRFYLSDTGNAVTFADRSRENEIRSGHLDFDVTKPFEVKPGEAPSLIFRFDLAPLERSSILKPLQYLFGKTGSVKAKMANSLGL